MGKVKLISLLMTTKVNVSSTDNYTADAPARKSVIYSLPQDKPKIVFHAAMMAIQNFGFMVLYNSTWAATPHVDVCDSTRYAVGLISMTCFLVAFLCVGMGFGGYTDDKAVFALFWYLHLVGGSLYTASPVIIPVARYSDDGNKCSDLAPTNGERINAIWIMHAALPRLRRRDAQHHVLLLPQK